MSVVAFHPPLSMEEVDIAVEAFERAETYRDLYDAFVGVLGPHWLFPTGNEAEVLLNVGLPPEDSGYEVEESAWIESLPEAVVVPEYLERLGVTGGPPRNVMLRLMEEFALRVFRRLESAVVPSALEYFADKQTLSDLMTDTLSRLIDLDLDRTAGVLQNELEYPNVFSAEVRHIHERGEKRVFVPTREVGEPVSRILTVTSMLRRAEETAMPGVPKKEAWLRREATKDEERRERERARERARTETAQEVRDRQATGQRSIARMLLRTGLAAEEAHSKPAMWLQVCERAKELLTAGRMKESEREHAVRIEACRAALGVLLGFTAGDRENEVLFEDTGFVARGLPVVERMDRNLLLDTAWTLVMLLTGSYPVELLSEDTFAGQVAAEVLMRTDAQRTPLRRADEKAIEVVLEADVTVEEASNIISACIEKVAVAQDTHATSEDFTAGEMAVAGIVAALVVQTLAFAVSAQVGEEVAGGEDGPSLRLAAVAGGFAAVMAVDEDEQEDAAVDYVARGLGEEYAEMARPLVEEAVVFARGKVRSTDEGREEVLGLPPWSVMLRLLREV